MLAVYFEYSVVDKRMSGECDTCCTVLYIVATVVDFIVHVYLLTVCLCLINLRTVFRVWLDVWEQNPHSVNM